MCTSFATYFDKPIYGMNHDLFDTETKFTIVQGKKNINAFIYDVKFNDDFVHNAGMNDKGIFCNFQNDSTNKYILLNPSLEWVNADDIFLKALMEEESVKDIEDGISGKGVRFPLSPPNPKLHSLYADKNGYAVIIEAGEDAAKISTIKGKFIVMTNFTSSDFENKGFNEVFGPGDNRYIKAYEYLSQVKGTFKIEDAFNILKQNIQESSKTQTLTSMIFLPKDNEIYFVIKRRFDKVWKISLDNNILETFSGFKNDIKMPLDSNGICASDLEQY